MQTRVHPHRKETVNHLPHIKYAITRARYAGRMVYHKALNKRTVIGNHQKQASVHAVGYVRQG